MVPKMYDGSLKYFCMFLLFTTYCKGQIRLVPTTVPFKNEVWTLQCISDTSIQTTVEIADPGGTTVGVCEPTDIFPASCTPNAGYTFAINETYNTVSMSKTGLSNADIGQWTCQHLPDTAAYDVTGIVERNFPQGETNYFKTEMSPSSGAELGSNTGDNFTIHYGCISDTLKFKWETEPGESWYDISNTNSTALKCNTHQSYQSTQTTSDILQHVQEENTKLKVSVFADTYDSLPAIIEYTFEVTFSPSHPATTGEVFIQTNEKPTRTQVPFSTMTASTSADGPSTYHFREMTSSKISSAILTSKEIFTSPSQEKTTISHFPINVTEQTTQKETTEIDELIMPSYKRTQPTTVSKVYDDYNKYKIDLIVVSSFAGLIAVLLLISIILICKTFSRTTEKPHLVSDISNDESSRQCNEVYCGENGTIDRRLLRENQYLHQNNVYLFSTCNNVLYAYNGRSTRPLHTQMRASDIYHNSSYPFPPFPVERAGPTY